MSSRTCLRRSRVVGQQLLSMGMKVSPCRRRLRLLPVAAVIEFSLLCDSCCQIVAYKVRDCGGLYRFLLFRCMSLLPSTWSGDSSDWVSVLGGYCTFLPLACI